MAIGEYRRERYTSIGQSRMRTIAWSAIIAGVLLAIAIQLMLGLLGLGIGLAALPGSGQPSGAIASVAGIYSLLAALVGLFVGAYATARFAGLSEKTDAVLHGLVTWAVGTLLVVVVLGGTASSVLGGAFGAVGTSVGGLTSAAAALGSPSTDTTLPGSIGDDLRSLVGRQPVAAGDRPAEEASTEPAAPPAPMTAQNLATIGAGLTETASEAERQAAVSAIQEIGDLSQDAAQQRLATYQQSFDSALRDARQAADEAARTVASASFSAFIALFLGALVAIAGCFVGRTRRASLER